MIEGVVALTGIEWVTFQFTSVQLNVSCSFSVHRGSPDLRKLVPESLTCDRIVTPGVVLNRSGRTENPPFHSTSILFQFRPAADGKEVR